MTCDHEFTGVLPYPYVDPWDAPQWMLYRAYQENLPHALEGTPEAHATWVKAYEIGAHGGVLVRESPYLPYTLREIAVMEVPVCPNCVANAFPTHQRMWVTVQEIRRGVGGGRRIQEH